MNLKKAFVYLSSFVCVATFCTAQTAVLAPLPRQCFVDSLSAGKPLAGGLIYSCSAGTSCPGTPLATFTDSTGTRQNFNPVTLDGSGCTSMWLSTGVAYKFVAQNSSGVQEWSADNVTGLASTLTNSIASTTAISFSSTPTFTSLAQNQLFTMTLTGNVTSSNLVMSGITPPGLVSFEITQDGTGGRTFVWPVTMFGAVPVSSCANCTTTENFIWDGATAILVSSSYNNSGTAYSAPGNIQTPSLNNIAYVDGQHYPQTGAGLSQAITDSIANGTREVHVCGTIPISTTINLTTGGVSIVGCGSSGINNALVPTAMLQWTGAAGSDLLQITGQASPRLDKIKLQNLILDGGGTDRYDLRMEKVDIVSLYDVRFRNSATAGLYAVDSTGIEGVNVNCGTIATYCMVLDWGTGGSIFTGLQVENDVSSTLPLILLQGASRGITFNGFQCDGTNTSFGGCIQITGFDTNSSFASAPVGGAGAPQSVRLTNPVVTIHAAATTPSQGADILITGTATNQSSNVTIEGLNDLGGTVSASAVKIDQANNVEVKGGISSSHTAASLNITANAAKVRRLFFQSVSDTASCTGTGCTSMSTVDQNSNGSLTFSPGITNLSLLSGITADGSGFKHKRFGATCTTTTSIGNSCTTTYSWTTAFADANYTPVCTPVGPANGPVFALDSFNAAGVTVRVYTFVALASGYSGVDCHAAHD